MQRGTLPCAAASPGNKDTRSFNNRIWSAFLILKMCTNSSLKKAQLLFDKKRKDKESQSSRPFPGKLCCVAVAFSNVFLSNCAVCSFSQCCVVKIRNVPVLMKHLSEKTGWEKIELMLIWPLGYHPAGEIWQTSAIHAAPLLITLLHSKLSSAYFWPRAGGEGKPGAKPEICLQRSLSSNHALKAPGEHTNSAVRYPWGKYPFTSQQHTKVCLKRGWNKKADTRQHAGCVKYPSCF